MSLKKAVSKPLHRLRVAFVAITVFQFSLGGPLATTLRAHEQEKERTHTRTPIKHVIALIGENRTFDHVFANYIPKSKDSVRNLLSEGIVKADGSPGPHFSKSAQFQAVAPFRKQFFVSLKNSEKAPYQILPQPTLNFSPNGSAPPPFPPATPPSLLAAFEPSLEPGDLHLLTTGLTGFGNTFTLPDPDTRVTNSDKLPNGPFPLTGENLAYDTYTGDTTHRLYEMWQQSDCSVRNATRHNPSGCLSDLYPFVIVNYTNQLDSVFDNPPAFDDNGGGNSMAFYNVQMETPPS